MNEIQVKVPREVIKRAAHNVDNFKCNHRSAVLIKMEDGTWTNNLCCEAGHRYCDCSDECGERKFETMYYMENNCGDECHFDSNSVVDAIHKAWNIDARLYNYEMKMIFDPFEDNEILSEMIEEFGLRVIDHENYRKLQDIKTGEIFNEPWESN